MQDEQPKCPHGRSTRSICYDCMNPFEDDKTDPVEDLRAKFRFTGECG